MRYKNYIWDFDGTLFDTYPHMVDSMVSALGSLDCSAVWEEVYQSMKHTVPATVHRYSERYGLDPEKLLARYLETRRSDPAAEETMYPGAKDLLRAICKAGGRHFIFTHRGFTARQILHNIDIEGLFVDVVTASDGFPRKPDPAAVQYLMNKYGLIPDETVIIGDRHLDIETGKNAGIDGILFDPDHYYDGERIASVTDSMVQIAERIGVIMSNFFDLAKDRYSVRKFAPLPVEGEKLFRILECGRLAPTAKNNQPQKIYVLESEEALAKVRALTRCTFDAPVVLLICGDKKQAWINPHTGHSSAEMDASIVATHMMMAAEELGLGTTWVCWFDTEKAKEVFALPEDIQPYCLLPIGYPADDAVPSPNHLLRKPLEETVEMI